MQSMATKADLEHTMIDATIVRAHACSAGLGKDTGEQEALGRSKGGFTSKIHALVDSLGNPLKFILTAGQRNDITQAQNLTQDLKNTILIADKGYDSNALIDSLAANNCKAVIPPKKNRKEQREYDEHIYKERHLIECFFGKMKHFRKVFSRLPHVCISPTIQEKNNINYKKQIAVMYPAYNIIALMDFAYLVQRFNKTLAYHIIPKASNLVH